MSQVEEDFRVELNIFRGPLDLLLYLVRKHELEVADIPIAEVLDQYLEFLDIMEVGLIAYFKCLLMQFERCPQYLCLCVLQPLLH